jgi:uncharacterized protein YjlB
MSPVGRRDLLSLGIPATLGVLEATDAAAAAVKQPRTALLKGTAAFPNSGLPALIYEKVLTSGDMASSFEQLFAQNGWTGSWRNGLYRTHHYHSTAHEVLGVYRGSVKVRLGGPDGPVVELRAGDVAVIPAGVAHKNESQSDDFAVVGAYPTGTSADLQYGKEGERPRTDGNIAAVPLPAADPAFGKAGALPRLWR